MQNLLSKVAVITGANSGIGRAIASSMVQNGMQVVGLARNEDKLHEVQKSLLGNKGKFYSIKTDITKDDEVLSAFQWIEENLGGINVLVNNAGDATLKKQEDETIDSFRSAFDVNVFGLNMCTKAGLKSMKAHNIDDGYIINITSSVTKFNVISGWGSYYASRTATHAFIKALQTELAASNSKIRVTTIYPGITNTDLIKRIGITLSESVLETILKPTDVADTVIYLLQQEPRITISDLTIKPTASIRLKFKDDSK